RVVRAAARAVARLAGTAQARAGWRVRLRFGLPCADSGAVRTVDVPVAPAADRILLPRARRAARGRALVGAAHRPRTGPHPGHGRDPARWQLSRAGDDTDG